MVQPSQQVPQAIALASPNVSTFSAIDVSQSPVEIKVDDIKPLHNLTVINTHSTAVTITSALRRLSDEECAQRIEEARLAKASIPKSPLDSRILDEKIGLSSANATSSSSSSVATNPHLKSNLELESTANKATKSLQLLNPPDEQDDHPCARDSRLIAGAVTMSQADRNILLKEFPALILSNAIYSFIDSENRSAYTLIQETPKNSSLVVLLDQPVETVKKVTQLFADEIRKYKERPLSQEQQLQIDPILKKIAWLSNLEIERLEQKQKEVKLDSKVGVSASSVVCSLADRSNNKSALNPAIIQTLKALVHCIESQSNTIYRNEKEKLKLLAECIATVLSPEELKPILEQPMPSVSAPPKVSEKKAMLALNIIEDYVTDPILHSTKAVSKI